MTAQTAATNFHLTYNAEEDRLLVSVDATPEREYAMALTRRLAKRMLGTLADMQAKSRMDSLGVNPLLRETVLNFEHAQAVAAGFASGETRARREGKPLVATPRTIHEVKLTPKPGGGIVVVLDDQQQLITIDMTPQRVHAFMAGILDIAEKAGWDLPKIAAWLDRAAAGGEAAQSAKIVH